MTPKRFARYKATLNKRQPDLTLITDQVHKGRNLSALIRTCDSVGIQDIHITQPKEGYRPYKGTAMGSHQWLDIHQYKTVSEPILLTKNQGYQIIAAHFSDKARYYYEVDYTKATALVLGGEKYGLSTEAMSLVDQCIVIPMQGMVASLNVSSACSIILAEAQRQRMSAGLYANCRLNKARFNELLFRWSYPEIAEFCQQKAIAFPETNDAGLLVNPSDWYRKIRENA